MPNFDSSRKGGVSLKGCEMQHHCTCIRASVYSEPADFSVLHYSCRECLVVIWDELVFVGFFSAVINYLIERLLMTF